jgi:hypothetical protein
MRISRVKDCRIVDLPIVQTESGSITSLNNSIDIPFNIKRVYYLYDVPNQADRGAHAHKELQQLIVAVSGSFTITLFDGFENMTFILNQPNQGLLLVPGIWRELNGFSGGGICLVLASHEYQESDYIRDYHDYLEFKK